MRSDNIPEIKQQKKNGFKAKKKEKKPKNHFKQLIHTSIGCYVDFA